MEKQLSRTRDYKPQRDHYLRLWKKYEKLAKNCCKSKRKKYLSKSDKYKKKLYDTVDQWCCQIARVRGWTKKRKDVPHVDNIETMNYYIYRDFRNQKLRKFYYMKRFEPKGFKFMFPDYLIQIEQGKMKHYVKYSSIICVSDLGPDNPHGKCSIDLINGNKLYLTEDTADDVINIINNETLKQI